MTRSTDKAREWPTPATVKRILTRQAPHLAGQTVVPTESSGSSNWVFRLGRDLAVRLPRSDDYVDDLMTEVTWLPRLGPALCVPVPKIVFVGQPSTSFPRPWTIVTWIPGRPPQGLAAAEQLRLAKSLGRFARDLHSVDTFEEAAGPDRWGYRSGEPVTERIDQWVKSAASELADLFDPTRVLAAWERLRDVPTPSQRPCWIHTDLSAENILVDTAGDLTGVIDFGGLGIGDPSVDLLYAWSLFGRPARDVFKDEAGADDATWRRARAWAFAGPGLLTIANYRHSMPARTQRLIGMVDAVAAEVDVHLRAS